MLNLLAFILLVSSSASALSGSLKSSTDSYSQDLGKPTDDLIPYLQFELADKHKFTKRLRVQWKLVALGNLEAEGDSIEKAPFREQGYVDLPEGFVERKWGSNKLRLGMNTVNWSVADVFSPSNVINTSAFFHPLRTPRRGAPMVEFQTGGESFGIHALYIPWQPRAALPSADSRWLPRDFLINLDPSFPKVALPPVLEYSYNAETQLDRARQDNYGVKINAHSGSWDFQATHFDGASPFPKIKPALTINSGATGFVAASPIVLNPISYRIRNTGAGITHAGEKLIVRLEGAYTHVISEGDGLQPWNWTAVGGLETNIDFGASAITILAQYYHGAAPQKADNYISSSYRMFDRTAVLGLRWPLNDKWVWTASGLYEIENHGLFWTAGFENKIKDALKWGLGWRDFSAQKPGLIQTFDRNDHLNLDLTYFF